MIILREGALTEYTVDDVYGITREVPMNYTNRDSVDGAFIENLARDKHIVVYGSSKQGKTCLRKNCLKENDYIVVQCSNRWPLEELHANILKRAGFRITQSEKRSSTGRNKLLASLGASLFGFGARAGTETQTENRQEVVQVELELDPGDVNDVIAALKNIHFTRYLVLEDFHYLPIETQKDFAVALKAFHEVSTLTFIIIGVWLEENRLIVYNGDLTGRMAAVNADKWLENELDEVIEKGAGLLNVAFEPTFKTDLIQRSYGSVYTVQEACRQACLESGITRTQTLRTAVGVGKDVSEIVRNVVNQQSGRYRSFIEQFSQGFQETRLQMYRWLLHPILCSDSHRLESGFKWSELRKALQEHHPARESLNLGNLTQALASVASLQVAKNIKPIILDYDQTNSRLTVVDRGFIIWLGYQDQAELLSLAGLPDE
jgi:hypothetical protein